MPHNPDFMYGTPGPQRMTNDSLMMKLLDKINMFGPKDINLPNQSGQIDPRLVDPNVMVDDMLQSGATGLHPLKGLKKAFGQ